MQNMAKKALFFLIMVIMAINTTGTELIFDNEPYCIIGNDCTLHDLLLTGNITLIGSIVNITIINQNIIGQVNITGSTNIDGNATANYFFGNGSFLKGLEFSNFNLGNVSNDTISKTNTSILFNWNLSNIARYINDTTNITLYNRSIDLTPYQLISNVTSLTFSNFQLANVSNNTLVKGDNATLALWNKTGNNIFLRENTGNVGIGTTVPGAKLSVNDATASQAVFYGYSPIGGASDTLAGSILIGKTAAYQGKIIYDAIGSTADLYIDNTYDVAATSRTIFRMRTAGTPVNAVTILGSGNVGIGTASPDSNSKLHVAGVGGITVTGNYALVPGVAGLSLDYHSTDNAARISVADGAGGWTKNLALQPYGGNVGIGTTGPTRKLHVIGNVNVTGDLSYGTLTANSPHAFINFQAGEALKQTEICIVADNNKVVMQILHYNIITKKYEWQFTENAQECLNKEIIERIDYEYGYINKTTEEIKEIFDEKLNKTTTYTEYINSTEQILLSQTEVKKKVFVK